MKLKTFKISCILASLATIGLLEEQIEGNGADLIVGTEFPSSVPMIHEEGGSLLPFCQDELSEYIFYEPFLSASVQGEQYPLVEHTPGGWAIGEGACFPSGICVLPKKKASSQQPIDVTIAGYSVEAVVLTDAQAPLLRKIYPTGAVFFPYGLLPSLWDNGFSRKYVFRVKKPNANHVGKIEKLLRDRIRLDKKNIHLVSSRTMLEELVSLRKSQRRFRMGISLVMSVVIGTLLTALSSLEFRENQYVYALMNSFGVGRPLLVANFLGENLLLVWGGFLSTLAIVSGAQSYLVAHWYQRPGATLDWNDFDFDIRLLSCALIVCTLVSCIPVGCAACRQVGHILK